MKVKEKREKRAKIYEEMKTFNNGIEGRAFTPEEEERWKKMNDDLDDLKKQIERQEKLDELQGQFDGPANSQTRANPNTETAGGAERKPLHLRCYLKKKLGMPLTDEERGILNSTFGGEEFVEYKLQRNAPRTAAEIETRDLNVGTPGDGGNLVPDGFVNRLELAKLAFGNVRAVSEIMRTPTGNELTWPRSNDTGNKSVLVAEAASVASGTTPTFALTTLNSYKYTTKILKITHELLRDNEVDIERVLADMLGERMARGINEALTVGDGSSKPNGVVTASALGVTAAGAAAITMDETLNLFHSVNSAYRDNAQFMFADTTLLILRKLKDSNGNYIWQVGTREGAPDRLWGKPTVINDDVPVATTGLRSMLFGDFSKYKVREVGTVRLIWAKELYLETDEWGVVLFESVDGELMNAGTNPIKHLLQA